MTFGFALFVFGYAVFYWGLHHFPGCLGTCQGKGCCKRHSLFELLGLKPTLNLISTQTNQPVATDLGGQPVIIQPLG